MPDGLDVRLLRSALLEVRVSGERAVATRVPVTVIAPYEPSVDNDYSVDIPFRLGRMARDYLFFRVPESAESLRVEYRQSASLCMNGLISTPEGRLTPDWGRSIPGGDGLSVILPSVGVWQASLMDWGPHNFFDPLNASDADRVASGTPRATMKEARLTAAPGGRFTVQNLGAPIYGAVETHALGVARRVAGVLAPFEQRAFDIDVEAGTEALLVDAHAEADVDLYLFDCTRGACASVPTQQGNSLHSHERVWLEHPAPGPWTVVLGRGDAGARSAGFQYTQVVTHPRYGALISDDAMTRRKSGEVWSTGSASAAIFVMAAVTYIARAGEIRLVALVPATRKFERFLHRLPGSVLAGLTVAAAPDTATNAMYDTCVGRSAHSPCARQLILYAEVLPNALLISEEAAAFRVVGGWRLGVDLAAVRNDQHRHALMSLTQRLDERRAWPREIQVVHVD